MAILREKKAEYTTEGGGKAPHPKLGGLGFWLVLGLAIVDDVSDVAITAINLVFTATVAAIPIAILFFLIGILISVTVFIGMQLYFITHGGLHSSAKLKRFAAWFFAIFCEMIPILQLLPTTTILFILIAWLENTLRKDNILAHALKNTVDARGGGR